MAGAGFSTPGTYTPLQLIAGAGLLNNQGIAVPATLTNAVSSYNSITFVSNLNGAIAAAPGFGISANIVTTLKTLASNACPALGSSVPGSYAGMNVLLPVSEPGGFGNLVANNAAMYLGDGSVDKFCQIFQIAAGYRQSANDLICSAVNATMPKHEAKCIKLLISKESAWNHKAIGNLSSPSKSYVYCWISNCTTAAANITN